MTARAVLVNPLALEVCAGFASTDPARPNIGSVRVFPDGSMIATDGHRAIRVNPSGPPAEEYPDRTPEGQHAPESGPVAVPRAVALKFGRSARKLVGKSAHPVLRSVAVSTNEKTATVTATNLDSTERQEFEVFDHSFPDASQYWPTGDPVLRIGFNATMLAEVLEGVAKFGSGSPQALVVLEFRSPLAPCVVTNSNGSAQALVMPMRLPGNEVTL